MTSTRSAERRSARAAAAAPGADGVFTHRQILTILAGLMLGMFLAALDQTVVSTAIRTIADDLQGYDLQAWATTAFLITSTISTPLYGKLSDIYGRRPFYLFAIAVFVIGSALCGIADVDVRARRVAGGAGHRRRRADVPGAGHHRRPRAAAGARQVPGLLHGRVGTSSVLGPVVGGFLAGQSSILGVDGWRWIFWINVPLGIAGLRRRHARAAPAAHAARAPHRLARRAGAGHRTRAAADRRRAGAHLGLGLDRGARLLRHRRRRPRRLRPGRACLRRGRAAAAAPVRQPQLRGRPAWAASSWAPACSAACSCCRSTCRSCTARAPPWQACRCCRWSPAS